MKRKLLNLCLILTSLLGYLEWGGDNKMFLFQGELDVLAKLFKDPVAAAHPLTLMPLFGQILLLFTLFQREPSKILTFIGLGCLSLLLLFMFLIGLLSLNLKILLSTIPFIMTGIVVILSLRRN
jgi:cobalamin biosynthesis protein CobD/CbiB